MSVIQKTVSEHGLEKGFIEALYDAFLEVDGVVLNPAKENIDTLFPNTEVAYTFTLTYRGIDIVFTRANPLSSTAIGFKILVPNTKLSEQVLNWGGGFSYLSDTTRTVKFTFVVSDDAIEMIFTNYNGNYFDTANNLYYLFIPIKNTETYLYKGDISAITMLSDKVLYKLNENIEYKIARNFPLVVPNNGIKMLEFSLLSNNNSEWIMNIQGLNNCTTVPVNTKLTLGKDEYFSIGTDVIVKI